MTLKLAIAGIAGRMGRALVASAAGDSRFACSRGTERTGSPLIGSDIGGLAGLEPTGHRIVATVAEACADADVWIDFTTAEATVAALAELGGTKIKAAIIGTTGLNPVQFAAIEQAAKSRAIVYSGNYSLGVNVIAGLIRQAAQRLGPDWDIEVLEAHHRRKVDAPSGTALMLGKAAAEGRGIEHDAAAIWARHGQTGPRSEGDIGYAVLRAGGIIGEHEVMFANEDEIIRIGHSASTRNLFSKGALAAAFWAKDQPPGLYSMSDVLGF